MNQTADNDIKKADGSIFHRLFSSFFDFFLNPKADISAGAKMGNPLFHINALSHATLFFLLWWIKRGNHKEVALEFHRFRFYSYPALYALHSAQRLPDMCLCKIIPPTIQLYTRKRK